ncbi:hypothetical protein L3Q82_008183 [Scortum barcoo]|uniref:Uncharacterized protein n=1 Tax=Scortum barcoo TaxID=214431 RepID=A0ACB8WH06_9TELE|nr:hypothetical protein L3Q82_008183 [Scortum barcoo]
MEIISHGLLSLFVLVLWIQGLADGSDVTQTDILWEKEGNDAKMECSHKKGAGYNQMYWYRQLLGETMELIVYTTLGIENHDFGHFNKTKFTATKPDGDNGTFTVNNLQPGDKGLYFCASVSQCRNREEGKDIMIRNLSRIALLLLWLS